MYLVNYGPATFSTNPTTHIGRIEYTGTCSPAEPKYPKPDAANALASLTRPHPGLRADARSVRVDEPGAYRLRILDFRGREVFSA